MTTPDTGTAAAAVTIHQSATESMRDLIGQQLEKARVGVFKIPDEAWSAYLAELSERLNEWAASGVPTPPNLSDLSGYGRIMALCHDAEPVALEKFLGAHTAFLVSKGLAGDAANRILLGVQWLYGSASAHQTDVAPLVARKVAEFRKIDAMIQPVQMIPAPLNGPARAKRLILDAADHGDGWLMASDYNDMTEKLRALFWNDSFTDLMAARIPMFLNRVLTGPDGKRMSVDDAEAAGLLLTDGAAVPPLRCLRGVRLDVLKALALDCRNDDLVQLIDGGTVAVGGIRPPAPPEQDEREEVQAPAPVQVNDGLPPVTTTELAAAFDDLNGWNEKTWLKRLGSASGLPWLLAARLTPGTQGGSAATWNPVIVASELVKRSPGHKRYVLGRFQSKHALKPWLDQLYEHVPSITEPT